MKNKNLLYCNIVLLKTVFTPKELAFNHDVEQGNESQAEKPPERTPTFIDASVLEDAHDAALDAGTAKVDSALGRAEQTDMLDAGANQSFHPMASVDAGAVKTEKTEEEKPQLAEVDAMLAKMKNFPSNLETHNFGQNLLQVRKDIETGKIPTHSLEELNNRFLQLEQKILSEKVDREIPRAIIGECKHRIKNFQMKGVIPYQGINYSFSYDRTTQSFTVIAGDNGAPKIFKFRSTSIPQSESHAA